jgi:hypothetical protein
LAPPSAQRDQVVVLDHADVGGGHGVGLHGRELELRGADRPVPVGEPGVAHLGLVRGRVTGVHAHRARRAGGIGQLAAELAGRRCVPVMRRSGA